MVKLYLIEKTKMYVRYEYYPEDKGKPGILQLSLNDGEVSLVQSAGDDAYGIYIPHAVKKLESYYKSGDYPKEDSATWF